MRKVIIALLLCMGLLALIGCSQKWKLGKCTQWGICKTIKDSIHIKDSTYLIAVPYSINADTAWMQLLLECDSLGSVYVRQSETWQGKYIEMYQKLLDNKLTIIAKTDTIRDTVHAEGKETTIYKEVVQQTEVRKLSTWQQIVQVCGYLFMLGVIILAVIFAIYIRRSK